MPKRRVGSRLMFAADWRKRDKQDFVVECHVVNARLPLKSADTPAESTLDIARGLGLQIEIDRKCVHADPFIDIGRAKAVRDPAERSKQRRDPVLESEMQRVVCLDIVEWDRLCIKRPARRGGIEKVAG